MVKIEWLPDAENDLNRLYYFVERHSQSAASLAISTLLEAVKTLKKFPEQGRPWDDDVNYRELFVKFGTICHDLITHFPSYHFLNYSFCNSLKLRLFC